MKKTFFLIALCLFSHAIQAQKFGYIDSEYITSKMSAYQEAMSTMNKYSEQWVNDIKLKSEEIEDMKLSFQQEEILLTEDMKQTRLAAIKSAEDAYKKMNNDIFGLNGQLFLKKKEIMKPIMDEVYNACEKVARQKKLMFIFDKAADISMIYTNPRHDYTDYVMEALGLIEKEK